MAGRSLTVLDIREIIRCLRMKESAHKTARSLRMNRRTVAKYREWANRHGLLQGQLPDMETIEKLLADSGMIGTGDKQISKAAPYHDKIEQLLGLNCSAQVIFERLSDNYGFDGGYDSVKRYVRKLKEKIPEAFIRVEVAPGKEAQVDFGSAGWMLDPIEKRLRRVWCFVMVLSHSRHMFVRFVFDQKIATWLKLHREAFEFFGGVPGKIVLDNLKTAIAKAVLYDTALQRTYSDFGQHYGFLISPCRVGTPHHKGKVESGGVKFVKRNFLPGRSFIDINEANEKALFWCMEKGLRIHGTTKWNPIEVFEKVEKNLLLPLPKESYKVCWWKECKLHPDCHIVLDGSYYSAPYTLIGRKLWVHIAEDTVRIFHDHQQVGMHLRSVRKGERRTIKEHMPPEKQAYFMCSPTWCREQARQIGESTYQLIDRLLTEKPLDKLRTAQGILRLEHKYGKQRLEAACKRALFYDEVKYGTVSNILKRQKDKEPLQPETGRDRYFTNGKFARYTIGGLFNDQSVDTAA